MSEKIPVTHFRYGQEVLVKCEEAGHPPHFPAVIAGLRIHQGKIDFTVREPDGSTMDGYTEDWLTPACPDECQGRATGGEHVYRPWSDGKCVYCGRPERVEQCPQCGAATVQPRDAAGYCEDCGWPEEDRSKDELPESIRSGTFLLVGHGETYGAEVVKGCHLLTKMMEMIFGMAENAPDNERQNYAKELSDMDNWCQDQDHGPTWYKTDLGETDHIEVIRITG